MTPTGKKFARQSRGASAVIGVLSAGAVHFRASRYSTTLTFSIVIRPPPPITINLWKNTVDVLLRVNHLDHQRQVRRHVEDACGVDDRISAEPSHALRHRRPRKAALAEQLQER